MMKNTYRTKHIINKEKHTHTTLLHTHTHIDTHLALQAFLVLSEGVEQPVAECGDQARVGAVAQHGGALPRACLAIGQQRGVVALQGALKHPLPQVLEHTRLGEEGDEGDEGEEGSLFLF